MLNSLLGILVGLLSLGLMMLVHELGHYLMGRLLGFKIEEFSIFMGPRIASWEKNGIRYSLKLLPIGASVAFAGESVENEPKDGAEEGEKVELTPEEQAAQRAKEREEGIFHAMPVWKRALTILAGPAMNFLMAFIIMLVYFGQVGMEVPVVEKVLPRSLAAQAEMEEGDRILRYGDKSVRSPIDLTTGAYLAGQSAEIPIVYESAKTGERVETVVDGSPVPTPLIGVTIDPTVQDGGLKLISVDPEINNEGDPNLKKDDRILTINGRPASYEILQEELLRGEGAPLTLEVEREGVTQTIESKPSMVDLAPSMGIILKVEHDPKLLAGYSWDYGVSVIGSTLQLLGRVFTGGVKMKDAFSGPVGIVGMYTGIVAGGIDWTVKLLQWLSLTFMISLALGFGNLLPIPPLDGGVLLFLIYEGIFRKPVPEKVQYWIQMIGIGFFMILAIYILGVDIWRLTQ